MGIRTKEQSRKYYAEHKDAYTRYRRIGEKRNRLSRILSRVKSSAKTRGILFDLKLEDLSIPEHCPVLGTKLFKEYEYRGLKEPHPNSISIDRIDNSKGYTKDNSRIISFRANHLKSDATLEELEKIVEDARLHRY